MPSPSEETIIRRIEALLAQAESTNYPDEAEAFFAKATRLMDKYRIDEARVRRAEDDPTEHFYYDLTSCKYLRASLKLLTAVGHHYGLVVLVPSTGNSKRPHLVGKHTDIKATMMMFGSLIVQRDREALRTRVPDGDNKNRFYNSFALGYAVKIHERLKEIRAHQEAAAKATSDSLALAVYDRRQGILDELGNPGNRTTNRPTIDPHAAGAGARAAATADLGGGHIAGRGAVALGR